jgi:lipoyl-dependent peroxiredoxin
MSIQPVDVMYTGVATADNGRDGRVVSDDGKLDLAVSWPEEMGGNGAGTNPEQLFAAGYSACFHGSLGLVAGKEGADITGSTVTAKVSVGTVPAGGYGLTVALETHIPNVDADTAKALVDKAHEVCPYSSATRGNVEVTVDVV